MYVPMQILSSVGSGSNPLQLHNLQGLPAAALRLFLALSESDLTRIASPGMTTQPNGIWLWPP